MSGSFKTRGQEFMDKFIASVTVLAFYLIAVFVLVYALEWFGPDMSKRYVCECNGVEVGEAVIR